MELIIRSGGRISEWLLLVWCTGYSRLMNSQIPDLYRRFRTGGYVGAVRFQRIAGIITECESGVAGVTAHIKYISKGFLLHRRPSVHAETSSNLTRDSCISEDLQRAYHMLARHLKKLTSHLFRARTFISIMKPFSYP